MTTTREQKIATLREDLNKDLTAETNYGELNDALMSYNEMVKGGEIGEQLEETMTVISELVDQLNKHTMLVCWKKIKEQAEPVLTAIELGSVDLIRVKGEKLKDDSKKKVLVLDSKQSILDLADLCEFGERKLYFHDKKAIEWMNCLNHAFYDQKCKDGNITPCEKLANAAVHVIQKDMKLAGVDSKASRTKAIQQIVDAVIYVADTDKKGNEVNKYKADARYATLLWENYTKWGRTINSIVFPKETTFRQMTMRILHLLVTGCELIGE